MVNPIVFGYEISPAVRSVLLTAKAIGLGIDLREPLLPIHPHETSDYVTNDPQLAAPSLDDDGFLLADSHAICPYLIDKYATNDWPYFTDPDKRLSIKTSLTVNSGRLLPVVRNILIKILRDNVANPQEEIDALAELYEFLENQVLIRNMYMAGVTVTIADFCCISWLSSVEEVFPVNPARYPKLTGWLRRMAAAPYYEEANGTGARAFKDFLRAKIQALS